MRYLCLFVFVFLIPAMLRAQDAPAAAKELVPKERELVGFLFEWIQLDHVTANNLIRKHALMRSADELRAEVEKLLDSGDAELFESVYLATVAEQRAKVESIEELIYPTEFEPPQIGEGEKPETIPATPTAFDVRNVGTTVEIDPVVSKDGERIDINFAPEVIQYLGDRILGGPANPSKELAAIRQPDFYAMRVSSAVSMKDGETLLLCLLTPNPRKQPDKRVLLFLRGNVLR